MPESSGRGQHRGYLRRGRGECPTARGEVPLSRRCACEGSLPSPWRIQPNPNKTIMDNNNKNEGIISICQDNNEIPDKIECSIVL